MKAYGKDSGGIWRIIEDNLRTLTTLLQTITTLKDYSKDSSDT